MQFQGSFEQVGPYYTYTNTCTLHFPSCASHGVYLYLHVPPFEDQGEDRTKAETGNFIQSIQQLGEKREGEGKEGRSEEGRGGEKEERREGKERERRVGINHCTIHSTRCCTGSGSHGRLLSPGHSEGLPLFEETLTEDSPKRKGRRRGRWYMLLWMISVFRV